MNIRTAIFAIGLCIALSCQLVQAEDFPVPGSESVVAEEVPSEDPGEETLPLLEEGEEVPGLEEEEGDGVTERGVRRFRLTPRKRITIPQPPKRPRITIQPPARKNPRITIQPHQTTKPLTPPPQGGKSFPIFVPNEVIVKLRPGMSIPSNAMQALGLGKKEATSSGAFLFQLVKQLQTNQIGDPVVVAKKLMQLGSVLYAQPNFIKQHFRTPNDDLFPEQWHYRENGTSAIKSPGGIGLPHVWDKTLGSQSVVVAVLDTGIVRIHPEIEGAGNLLQGFDMISDPIRAKDGHGRDSDPTDPGDGAPAGVCGDNARSDSWHGTHVAGTIGVGGTNNRIGISGVNWLIQILPVRVLGKCGGDTRDINDGIRWAAGLSVPGVPINQNPARIINMSLGAGDAENPLPCFMDPDTQAVINEVVTKKGVMVVVSAGNKQVDASLATPASCNNVITVAASDARGHLARYSNFGPLVEIMAPGGDVQRDDNSDGHPDGVLSLYHPNLRLPATASIPLGFAFFNGTSMAAPHVSGVLALWLAIEPSLTNAELLQGLRENAFPRTPIQCPKPCGAGLLNADLSSILPSPPPPPPGTQPPPPPPPVAQCTVKTSDIVHSLKIDIGDNDSSTTSAKQSLLRMLIHGDLQARREASGMVKATEDGTLAGIFQSSKGPVASRGQRMIPPRGWWDLIPQGQLGMCLQEPAGEPPMIIYRNQEMQPSVLDDTLRKAWRQCGLPTPVLPCTYVKDMEDKVTVPATGGF
ncbi:MAG: S8 family peptidase [Nitrospirota bacterium]|nr:S8 family peptidase [Nitrospirota bacterium]MDH5584997.1 S8 family peptidase [Nitrospirota bacterium]MDH5774224.1 S8 family peptidase [Nitrospirota bacterium]